VDREPELTDLRQVHIVQFDTDFKIRQIRQYWDQGSLLKQIEVIGSRARNWPIRDGKDQTRLIANSVTSEQQAAGASRRSTSSRDPNEVVTKSRSHSSSTTSATGDPHATLSLFQPRSVNDENGAERLSGPSIAPRSSAKPPSRDLTNILSGEELESATPSAGTSPRKNSNGGAPKGGAGSHYHPIRLFDENDRNAAIVMSPEKKANPKKYNHFEFGHGEDATGDGLSHVNNKHQSQWAFADFVTPEKPKMKIHTHTVRTMESLGEGEDEVSSASPSPTVRAHINKPSAQAEKSPVFRPVVHQARPDASTHFTFEDAGTPAADKVRPPRRHKNGLSLYNDNVGYQSDEETAKQPLSQLTNVNQEHRQKDFGPHFEISDQSPSVARNGKVQNHPNENTAKVLKGMNSNWQAYDESPDATAKKENLPERGRGIKTTGDGMGGSKGANRHWGFGDDSDTESSNQPRTKGTTHKPDETKSFWDF
jgi:hypothetical protein